MINILLNVIGNCILYILKFFKEYSTFPLSVRAPFKDSQYMPETANPLELSICCFFLCTLQDCHIVPEFIFPPTFHDCVSFPLLSSLWGYF